MLNSVIRWVPRVGSLLALTSFLLGVFGGVPAKMVLQSAVLFAVHTYLAITLWDLK